MADAHAPQDVGPIFGFGLGCFTLGCLDGVEQLIGPLDRCVEFVLFVVWHSIGTNGWIHHPDDPAVSSTGPRRAVQEF
jgi:hypothetical protein